MHSCMFGPNPSSGDAECKRFEQAHPGRLKKEKDEVLLYPEDKDDPPLKTCYHGGGSF